MMKFLKTISILSLFALSVVPNMAHADVFASNIRITQQGSQAIFDGIFKDGTGIEIRFVLSDHADSVVAVIKEGGTEVRRFTTNDIARGDQSVVWDGKNNAGVYAAPGDHAYTVELTTYDKGYATYTTLYDQNHGIFTRGVTAITNPALKNFGFIYTADNGGYSGKGTGVMRHAADGTEWGDVKGAAKLTTTGSTIGSLLRYSSEADQEGYVYLLNRSSTAGQVHRYHTDSLNIVMIDSGQYNTTIQGIGIRGTGSGRYLAIVGYQTVYGFLLGNKASHFSTKDIILDGDSTVEYYDVAFGRDSMMYATYWYTAKDTGNTGKSGVAKFDMTGYNGTPRKLTDAVWKTTAVVGKTTTIAYYKHPAGVASDKVYYVINGAGSPATGIYAIADVNSTPVVSQIYVDETGGNSSTRADITVDAVGNVIHFENSTENVAVISPATGPNNFKTTSAFSLKVFNAVSIAEAVVDANNDNIPDSLGKTVTVVGIVNSANWQGPSGLAVSIQDDNAGIYIFKSGSGAPVLKFGDRVAVTGEIQQFRGTTEIVPVSFADITKVDSNNTITPINLTLPQFKKNPEMYESRYVRVTGLSKIGGDAWPALGSNANMNFWDGWDTVIVRIDKDGTADGAMEPAYPITVQGPITQYTSSSTVYNDGYQISPNDSADITSAGNIPPNPRFPLVTPANGSSIKLDSNAQTFKFTWKKAVDLNGDNLVYQWAPIGFTAVTTLNGGVDSFLVRTGAQLRTMMGGKDTSVLKWTVKTKDPGNPIVNNVDTASVTLIKGTITGVSAEASLPLVFALEQNYPNPFNPSTTISYSIPNESFVTLKVYNVVGQEVATLVNTNLDAGRYTAAFDARSFGSGVYFYRIEAGSFNAIKKMLLLK